MAKKVTKKKATGRKASASKPTAKKAAGAKKVTKKAAPKKAAKRASKKAAPKKAVTKKGVSKPAPAKKVGTKKAAAKSTPRPKASAKKAATKKAATKKTTAKSAATEKKVASKTTRKTAPAKKTPSGSSPSKPESAKAATNTAGKKAEESKSGRKGITIVANKMKRKRVPSKKPPALVPPLSGSMLGMGLGGGKPLIQSGPKAPPITSEHPSEKSVSRKKPKSPFTKRQLDKYREILTQKRRVLLGDIDSMENEALKSESGALSHLPQHMAEQGSEAYEQTLSLDLAATDRKLLIEIDAALDRIAAGTFGLCELTGKPINPERLEELPWARYSIEAAREMERRTT